MPLICFKPGNSGILLALPLVMKTYQFFTAVSFMLFTGVAQAALNACQLETAPIEAQNISQEAIEAYRSKLRQECVVYKKYLDLRNYEQQFGVSLEKINLYQGLRYVDRYAYEKAKPKDIPVELIFQVKRADADKPISERSSLVWRNWTRGIEQLSQTKQDIEQGKAIDIPYLQKIHIGFFAEDESSENGDVLHPGELKNGIYPSVSWNLDADKIEPYTAVAKKIDDNLKALDLRPQLVAEEDYVNKLVDVREGMLYPAAPRAVKAHVTNMLKFLNAMMAQARENKPMIYKDHLYTPMQVAYFIQQYIVQIHGFHDGNGRISRFWQDVVLAVFDLPAGASGDLNYNDMTADEAEYYHRSLAKGFNELLDVEKCFTDVYPKLLPQNWKEQGLSVRSIDSSRIPYDCRFLK